MIYIFCIVNVEQNGFMLYNLNIIINMVIIMLSGLRTEVLKLK